MVLGILLSVLVVMSLKDRVAYFVGRTAGFRQLLPLNRVVGKYVDSVAVAGGEFDPGGLLGRYMAQYDDGRPGEDQDRTRARIDAMFSVYGAYLVKSHPAAFIWYCFVPDSMGYILPALGSLSAHKWLIIFSFLFLVCNLFYLWGMGSFIVTGGHRSSGKSFVVIIALVMALLVINFGFSTYVSPLVLGDQVFVLILEGAFGLLLADYIARARSQRPLG